MRKIVVCLLMVVFCSSFAFANNAVVAKKVAQIKEVRVDYQIISLQRMIKREFMTAENAYSPFNMSEHDKLMMGQAMRRIADDLRTMTMYVDGQDKWDIRDVMQTVENARFDLIHDTSASYAYRELQRAERDFDRVMRHILE